MGLGPGREGQQHDGEAQGSDTVHQQHRQRAERLLGRKVRYRQQQTRPKKLVEGSVDR